MQGVLASYQTMKNWHILDNMALIAYHHILDNMPGQLLVMYKMQGRVLICYCHWIAASSTALKLKLLTRIILFGQRLYLSSPAGSNTA
jgi:hypothetical protein